MARNPVDQRDEDAGQGEAALEAALAAGTSVAEAAKRAGVSLRTAWRRLDDPAVRERVRALRAAMVERAVGRLADSMTAAVETLVRNLDADQPAVQVRAAVALLDQAVRLRESEELERRVAELETLLGGQDGHRAAG